MKLKPSLITSFNVLQSLATPNVSACDILWPEPGQEIHADIYIMMEADTVAWNQDLGRQPEHVSAFELMSSIQPDQVSILANTIRDNALAKGVTVPSLTSFFPSLSLPCDNSEESHIVVIANLMRLALRLGQEFDRVPVVQMVAGSLISKIETGFYGKSRVVMAQCGDRNEMFNMILDRIEKALQIVGQDASFNDCKIEELRIAFELEPGPIYLLSDLASLESICDQIDRRGEDIKRTVGFNLDIPHFWIAENIDPSWIRSDNELAVRVKERIFHAHIAGHSERGHFGDISLQRMPRHQIEIFRDWLDAVSELDQVEFVSLEMEAARSFTEVNESVETLVQWLSPTASTP